MMKVGLVGLPNVGKSSFFNLLTTANAKVDLYPFTTIEKNIGTVVVPDERLRFIGDILKPPKLTYATIEFIDIAGLVKGASQGEGLGNKFLSHIRETDLILHIIRNFEDGSIPHIYNTVDPIRDVEIVESELALADLDIVKRYTEKMHKQSLTVKEKHRLQLLDDLESNLSRGIFSMQIDAADKKLLRDMNLFVLKPCIYAFNCSDKFKIDLDILPKLKDKNTFLFSIALEQGFVDFSEPEKTEMRQNLGLAVNGISGIVEECFKKLDLIRFYTIKGDESRAWTIPRHTNIVEAVGKIHSDMASGFIKAEVMQFNDLQVCHDFNKARETGHMRIEGKNYIVKDGDVILVKFASH